MHCTNAILIDMKLTAIITGLLIYSCIFYSFAQEDSAHSIKKDVVVISVSGEVDPSMAAFIGRALQNQKEYKDPLFLLEMDTFGGRLDAAYTIVDTLSNITNGKTVAFVTKRAISAGALIALACNKLVMKPNTTIGDCAPITLSNDGPKMLGEKFQSPLRAKFRALAKRNNYPPTLAESMVTAEMIVFKVVLPDTTLYLDSTGFEDLTPSQKKKIVSKTTVVKRGELLTMDDQEAKELHFSFANAESIKEVLSLLNITDYSITTFSRNWSEQFVKFIAMIAPILLMIGFAALYTEMKTPGFGVPGIIGIICLALVFGGQYMVGMANYTEMLLLIAGIVLLGVELFVLPGFGITGIAGILLMAVAMVLSLQDFVIPKPEMPWQRGILEKNILTIILSLLGSVVLIFLFFKYVFPRISGVISGPYLSATLAEAHSIPETPLAVSVGDRGVVTKTLRPSGSVKIDNNIYDVITDGEFINKDEKIIVTEIKGSRILVTRSPENDQ